MKTIGLIGGCSAESTSIYYAKINAEVRRRNPGHGAKLLLWSFDFDDIDVHCRTGDWDGALAKFRKAGQWLEAGGAEAVLICTNTMHRIAPALATDLQIPLIHIIDETANAIRRAGRTKPVLLGTRFTMAEPFYKLRLEDWGLETFLPNAQEREDVHRVIYEELIPGRVTETGRKTLVQVVERLAAEGADSVILGCTELGLSIRARDVPVAVFDTAEVHIDAAIRFIFDEETVEPA